MSKDQQISENQQVEDKFKSVDSFMEMDADSVQSEEMQSSDGKYYRPSLEISKNKPYKSLGRFILNVFDDTPGRKVHNHYAKFQYFLQDPANANGVFSVDDPSEHGETWNIVTTAFMKLRKHESTRLRSLANQFFKRKRYFYSLYMPMIDSFQEDTQGKIMIYRFGMQVQEKVEAQANPKDEMAEFKKVKKEKPRVVVYDPVNGKDFTLVINKDKFTDKYTGAEEEMVSYKSSVFDDDITPIDFSTIEALEGTDAAKLGRIVKTQESFGAFIKHVRDNAPDLREARNQKWSKEDHQKVLESLAYSINDDAIFEMVLRESWKQNPATRGTTFVRPSMDESMKSAVVDADVDEVPEASAFQKKKVESGVARKETSEEDEDFGYDAVDAEKEKGKQEEASFEEDLDDVTFDDDDSAAGEGVEESPWNEAEEANAEAENNKEEEKKKAKEEKKKDSEIESLSADEDDNLFDVDDLDDLND